MSDDEYCDLVERVAEAKNQARLSHERVQRCITLFQRTKRELESARDLMSEALDELNSADDNQREIDQTLAKLELVLAQARKDRQQ